MQTRLPIMGVIAGLCAVNWMTEPGDWPRLLGWLAACLLMFFVPLVVWYSALSVLTASVDQVVLERWFLGYRWSSDIVHTKDIQEISWETGPLWTHILLTRNAGKPIKFRMGAPKDHQAIVGVLNQTVASKDDPM